MKTIKRYGIGDLKTNFAEILAAVRAGEEIGISYGRKTEMVAVIIPISQYQKKAAKRKLGLLSSKKEGFRIAEDFEISDEELFKL
jgi:prevent-host-death family protein